MKMKMNGIRKYSGYIMIAVVVVFALLLFSYVHFSSTSTTQESFQDTSGNVMGTLNWHKSFSIDIKTSKVIDQETNQPWPNVTGQVEIIPQVGPSVTLQVRDLSGNIIRTQTMHVSPTKQLIDTASGRAMPDAEATYTNNSHPKNRPIATIHNLTVKSTKTTTNTENNNK